MRLTDRQHAAAVLLCRAPDYFGRAHELINYDGWAHSNSWESQRHTVVEALDQALVSMQTPKEFFIEYRDAAHALLKLTAGADTIGEVILLNDMQLPSEGKQWARDVLLAARRIILENKR